MVDLIDIKTAFSLQSNKELRRKYLLFRLLANPLLVKVGKVLLKTFLFFHMPLKWIIKQTLFNHFCGGETISESEILIKKLSLSNIHTILDYAIESNDSEYNFNSVFEEVVKTIEKAKGNKNISFCVFKITGIARFDLLKKVSSLLGLTEEELIEYNMVLDRIDRLCKKAFDADIPIFIDAEESWIQKAIDDIVEKMYQKYNKKKAIVYNTLQMYRTDRITYLNMIISESVNKDYMPGFKIVRGAYMEKERIHAKNNDELSPVFDKKEHTDYAFNSAIKICIDNHERVSLCVATHNEESTMQMVNLMHDYRFDNNDKRYSFAQLYGMSDNITYNLAKSGYNSSKYLPYGSVKKVVPYLMRRAEENTSIAGQTTRELAMLKKEMESRKKNKTQIVV